MIIGHGVLVLVLESCFVDGDEDPNVGVEIEQLGQT